METKPTPIERIRSWAPIAYVIARGLSYATTTVLAAIAAWYGSDTPPDWLPRALSVSAFFSGQLALMNLSGPKKP